VNGSKLYAPNLTAFVSSSAVGYYDAKLKVASEDDSPGAEFLSELCVDWEQEAMRASEIRSVRVCLIRTGLVLGRGGALAKMLPVFKLGLGGKLGSGKQWMNWIHYDDLISMICFVLEHKNCEGPFNAVSPHNDRNKGFTKTLGKVLSRPTLFFAPTFVLKLFFGQMSQLLLTGPQCSSKRIMEQGFVFKFERLEPALRNLLG
jgi:uncharacterized protein (TIGR01777 family)